MAAKREQRSLSEVARDLLEQALARTQPGQVQRVYAGLRHLKGIGKNGITNGASTINEVLYGAGDAEHAYGE